MNKRERTLMWGALGLTVAALVVMLYVKLVTNPTEANRKKSQTTRNNIEKLTLANSMKKTYEATLKDFQQRSYGLDERQGSEMSREHLRKLLAMSGLARNEVALTPVSGSILRNGGGREIGWVVRATGSASRLSDFLYLVDRDPHLHRIENITLSRVRRSTELQIQMKFVSVILPEIPGLKSGPIDPSKIKLTASLRDKQRKQYAMVASRDVFRPYMKKPPPPKVVRRDPPKTKTQTRPPDPPKPPPVYQVVGLATWGDEPQIVVREQRSQKLYKYKIGDAFNTKTLRARIIMVDYRPLPLPNKPKIYSDSRLIIKIGDDYWAVELGHTFDQKYRLNKERLPQRLRQVAGNAQSASATPTDSVDLIKEVSASAPKKLGAKVEKKEESDAR